MRAPSARPPRAQAASSTRSSSTTWAAMLVLTDLAPVEGGLVLPAGAEGSTSCSTAPGAVAEVAKGTGAERQVALPPGRYTVKKRLPDDSALLVAKVGVTGGAPAVVEDARMDRVPLDRDPQKGFSGARWALVAGLGAQRFFDRAARDGLFPPATLGGLELAVRDDLGRPRLGLRPGAGRRREDAPDARCRAHPVKFAEVAGGASLWKDLVRGPFVLSGARGSGSPGSAGASPRARSCRGSTSSP